MSKIKKFECDVKANEVHTLLKRMNTYPYKSEEYISIRNTIFNIYYNYPEHFIEKFIDKVDTSYEDLINDMYIYLLEAIESYNFSEYFTVYMNKFISYKIIRKYKLSGATFNNFRAYVCKQDSLEYNLEREENDIYDITIEDYESPIDKYIDKIEQDELRDIVVNLILDLDKLPSIQKRSSKNVIIYKMLLLVRFGLITGEKTSIKETASVFGKNEKWVRDTLTVARKYFKEAFLAYNDSVSEDEKIYIK